MLESIPIEQFDEWFDHYMEEPFGYEFEIYKHAEICTYLVNGLYQPKTLVKPSDFYPKKQQEQEQSWQDMKAQLRSRSRGKN